MQESDDIDDRLRWALGKLPRWAVRVDTGGMWVAVSPTYDLDGLVIHGRSAEELVHRVQVQVCVEAMAMDRAGKRPPGGVLCGVDFTGLVPINRHEIPAGDQLRSPGTVAIGPDGNGRSAAATEGTFTIADPVPQQVPQGRAFGFEGDPCQECGLMAMVRNGSCLKCTSCGATTGCS